MLCFLYDIGLLVSGAQKSSHHPSWKCSTIGLCRRLRLRAETFLSDGAPHLVNFRYPICATQHVSLARTDVGWMGFSAFRTAVPFRRQTTLILSSLSPKLDRGSKRIDRVLSIHIVSSVFRHLCGGMFIFSVTPSLAGNPWLECATKALTVFCRKRKHVTIHN